jgi:hypothetical protein
MQSKCAGYTDMNIVYNVFPPLSIYLLLVTHLVSTRPAPTQCTPMSQYLRLNDFVVQIRGPYLPRQYS